MTITAKPAHNSDVIHGTFSYPAGYDHAMAGLPRGQEHEDCRPDACWYAWGHDHGSQERDAAKHIADFRERVLSLAVQYGFTVEDSGSRVVNLERDPDAVYPHLWVLELPYEKLQAPLNEEVHDTGSDAGIAARYGATITPGRKEN